MFTDENCIRTAQRVAQESPDPHRKVGCVIVHPLRGFVGAGFNQIPERLRTEGCYDDVVTKLDRVIHAEEHALVNARFDLTGTTLYCTRMTCAECAKLVIHAGVARVVAPSWSSDSKWIVSFDKAVDLYGVAGIDLCLYEDTVDGCL